MKAKKFLSVLLTGAITVSILSGCTKEIIEHQIITETVHNGGSTGGGQQEAVVIEKDPVVQDLEELLARHGITLDIYTGTTQTTMIQNGYMSMVNLSTVEAYYDNYSTLDQGEFNQWIKENKISSVVYKKWKTTSSTFSLSEYFDNILGYLETMKEYLAELNDEGWETIQSNNYKKLWISISNFKNSQSGNYYTQLGASWR